ncbi:MAG: SUMF1/EgtB/PvdO family nonheme iron enzyme [Spirochaetaceae bacterium]|nr:SUMF1/EgtB/PvdO family nonheme iron enzyme [Spirochaetaceae bacterium]
MKKYLFPAAVFAAALLFLPGCPGPADPDPGPGIEEEEEEGDDQTVYHVTIDPALEGGTITASPSSGTRGTDITVTATPSGDLRRLLPGSLKYRYGSTERVINAVTLSFKLPGSDVTVGAVFEALYTVSVDSSLEGILSADPLTGPAGTGISLTLHPDYRLKQGTLKYNTHPVDITTLSFSLPGENVTVTADYELWANIIHRMVKVTGAVVNKQTGDTGHPLATPFSEADITPVTVEDYSIGAVEVPYRLWYTVKTWALSNGYTFPEGTGGAGYGYPANRGEPTSADRYRPVSGMSWWALIVWCNAYSEYAKANLGADYAAFEPVYKTATSAPSANAVLRSADLGALNTLLGPDAAGEPDINNLAPPAHNAPGFRLSTYAEWEFAARGGDPDDDAWEFPFAGSFNPDEVAWHVGLMAGSVFEITGKAPNTLGLYDMSGNAAEIIWNTNPSNRGSSAFSCGGHFKTNADGGLITWRSQYNSVVYAAQNTNGFRIAGPASIGVNP